MVHRMAKLSSGVLALVSLMMGGTRPGTSPGFHGVGASLAVEASKRRANGELDEEPFSPEWMEDFASDNSTCQKATHAYQWRGSGFGSNMNALLATWGYAIASTHRREIGLIVGRKNFKGISCTSESQGQESHGWSCLFGRIPNVCWHTSYDEWQDSLEGGNVAVDDRDEGMDEAKLGWNIRHRKEIRDALTGPYTDPMRSLSGLAHIIIQNMQPWVRADIDLILNEELISLMRKLPFVAMHIRRSDKTEERPSLKMETEEYMARAAEVIRDSDRSIDDIRGIWISSDDFSVIKEVQLLAQKYFPGVKNDMIIYISARTMVGRFVPTHTNDVTYPSMVCLFAEVQMLSSADVFVGTYSSNLGRLVALLREANGLGRETSVSLDSGWSPGNN